MASRALACCLQHPAVYYVIVGCTSVERLQANARSAELDQSRDDHPQATAIASVAWPHGMGGLDLITTTAPNSRMSAAIGLRRSTPSSSVDTGVTIAPC